MNAQKPKTKIKMKDTKKYKAIYCMTCRIGCRSSENLVDERSLSEPQGNPELGYRALPVLLMNYQWSREEKWNWVRVNMVSTRTSFPKNPNCDICLKKNKEGFLLKTCWYSRAQSGTLW